MQAQELDVIVRVAGATLLLWAAFGPTDRRPRAWLIFAPLALCLCGFLAGNTPEAALQLSGPVGRIAMLIAGYAAPLLWWWCLAVFDRGFRPRGAVLAVGIAWMILASIDRGVFGQALAGVGLSWVLITLGLMMVVHLAWRLFRDHEDDLIDRRRQARFAVAAVLGAQLFADLVLDLVFGLDWNPQAFTIIQNAVLLGFTGWLLSLDLSSSESPPTAGAEALRRATQQGDLDSILSSRLRFLMESERIYLNADLTFAAFVRAMDAPERSVRRLINQQLGHDHFRSFLNAWRVDEARRLLSDSTRRDEKLISIAMDSGFASLSSFNRVFRDMEGRTPSVYRDAVQGPSQT